MEENDEIKLEHDSDEELFKETFLWEKERLRPQKE